MNPLKPGKVLPIAVACAALSALVACGGGSDATPTTVANDPPAVPSPTPAPAPAPAPTPAPAPQPPGDPAPPKDIVLEPGYTKLYTTLNSRPQWPAWSHAGTAVVDGVGCAKNEDYHIHALLSIYQDGIRLGLPDSIGRGSGCSYEMHTHDITGILHVETDVPKVFTLGQFFALWGQPLGTAAVAGLPGTPTYYVIDKETVTRFTGDPATIALNAHREIVIVTGTPPAQVPRYDWGATGL
ncbi:hypothetical protein ACEN9H_22635 [Massilia cellulosiltytica]|uniref:hypothetical protein n=1 Tax=Massilia cellulosiltytica TaxID=2683234 RepID=UPI0039B3D729